MAGVLDVAQMGLELVEALGPDPAVGLDPVGRGVKRLPLQVAGAELGVPGA
jgi:hypothetical protein